MINKAILVGRLTADPELKQTPNGVSVVSFSIAVARSYATKGGERQTDFINIVAWRNTAEFISKYFRKGNMIGIDGSIQTRSYTDKDGNKRTAFEVVADNASFVESKSASSGASAPASFGSHEVSENISYSSGDFGQFSEVEADDLPF